MKQNLKNWELCETCDCTHYPIDDCPDEVFVNQNSIDCKHYVRCRERIKIKNGVNGNYDNGVLITTPPSWFDRLCWWLNYRENNVKNWGLSVFIWTAMFPIRKKNFGSKILRDPQILLQLEIVMQKIPFIGFEYFNKFFPIDGITKKDKVSIEIKYIS